MRIDNTRRPAPNGAVGSYQKAGETEAATSVPRATDATSFIGIPQSELTPKVQQAFTALMGEVDRMRQELDESQPRIEYMLQLADQNTLAPVANRRAFVPEMSRTFSMHNAMARRQA